MRQTRTRRTQKARPSLEGLEGRRLLDAAAGAGAVGPSQVSTLRFGVPPQDRHISYTAQDGSHVDIRVYGPGSLQGTTHPGGVLQLVFGETNASTGIVARVSGGAGHPLLQGVQPANLPAGNLTGVGSTVLNVLNLKDFSLVDGGRINLTGGVHSIFLDSVGSNTQINLRELPASFQTTAGGSSSTSSGVTTQFGNDPHGSLTLLKVSGQFVAGPNLVEPRLMVGQAIVPGPPPAPPGIVAVINHIHGAPTSSDPLGLRSGTFNPNLAGAALIDIQGNVQSIRGIDATGLVLNDLGNLNLVKFARISDSEIVGEPFGHADLPAVRPNVAIFSTQRLAADRNDVTVMRGLSPIGPLSLP